MSEAAVGENYAGALLELATRRDAAEEYGRYLAEVASLYREESRFRLFLDTPRVPEDRKKEVLREVLADRVPEPFLHFLLVVLEKRRERSIPRIEEAYRDLLDERFGRVHANVTLALEPDDELREEITDRLSTLLEREVEANFRTDESIVGGILVRFEDKVMDGSLRRRLQNLRRSLLDSGDSAAGAAAGGAQSTNT